MRPIPRIDHGVLVRDQQLVHRVAGAGVVLDEQDGVHVSLWGRYHQSGVVYSAGASTTKRPQTPRFSHGAAGSRSSFAAVCRVGREGSASRSAAVETKLFGNPLGQDQPPTVTECDHASRLDEGVRDDDLAPVQPVCDVVKPEAHYLSIPQHDMFILAHNTKAVHHAQRTQWGYSPVRRSKGEESGESGDPAAEQARAARAAGH